MVKIKDQIPEGLQEALVKTLAEPKKPKKPKRLRLPQCRIIASSIPEIEEKCKKVRYYENKEKQDTKCIPVLFMFGQPQRRLSKDEATEYRNLGAKVEYMTPQEAKSIK